MAKISVKIQYKMKQWGVTENELLEDTRKTFTKFKNMPRIEGIKNIPMQIFEYLKQSTERFASKTGESTSESGEGPASGNGSKNVSIKGLEKFREKLYALIHLICPSF